jgi:hypothetical protein
MLSKCANPECSNSFEDYRQGRLFRFHLNHPGGRVPANTHCVLHSWLCSSCSETYTLTHRDGQSALVIRRHRMFSNGVITTSDQG